MRERREKSQVGRERRQELAGNMRDAGVRVKLFGLQWRRVNDKDAGGGEVR